MESALACSSDTLVAASLIVPIVLEKPVLSSAGFDSLTVLSIDFLVNDIPLDAKSELRYYSPFYILGQNKNKLENKVIIYPFIYEELYNYYILYGQS